jgi:S-adenosylmethionine hydrolase
VITFLSDFGLDDDFVGTCHGVIKRIAPGTDVIDITHGIEPQSILQGAIVLANTLPYMPEGVHLAVVDPEVGTPRRALVVRTGGGRLLVGPDNGLPLPAAERVGGIEAAHEITNRKYALEPVSATFHGRDIFSPAAAHLARGVALEELGPSVEPSELERLEVPTAQVGAARIRATALYVDRFGNIQLNLTSKELEQVGIVPGTRVEVEVRFERYFAVAARTFADVRPGDIVLYEDAYRNIALAINQGDAANMFSARVGEEVRLSPAD